MNSIDQRIQTALSEEDSALLARYNENQNIFSEIAVSFRGSRGILMVLTWLIMFIWAGLFVYCAYQFLIAELTDDKLLWMAGGLLSFVTMIIVKLWYFIELNRNAYMREFKRLELQISLLAEKLP